MSIIPKTAVIELTYNCNHKCMFCSVPWDHPNDVYETLPELSIREWKVCVDKLVRQGVRTVAFSGGEPLLKEKFEELLGHVKTKKSKEPVFNTKNIVVRYREKGIGLTIITNGQLIDSKWIAIFQKYRPIVIVSLPGVTSFSGLTGGGDVNKSLLAIRNLSSVGIDVVVSICVTKMNLPELSENISLGFSHGAKQLLLNRFLQGGRGMLYPELCLDNLEIERMLDMAEEICVRENKLGSIGTELPRCIIKKEYKMLKIGTRCSGGVDFFVIDPSGMVRPCNHSPVRLGTYKDIHKAMHSEYWERFTCKNFLPKECHCCSLSLECDGGCREAAHLANGRLDSIDPIFVSNDAKPVIV